MMDAASPVQARPPAETTLFQAQGVIVTTQRLIAAGRTWRLGEVERVESIRRAPRVLPLLIILGPGVVFGLPALLAGMASAGPEGRGLYGAALALAALVIFAAIATLVTTGDTSWLVLRTRQRERRVFRSRDHQLVSSLAAAVSEAVAAARRRQ